MRTSATNRESKPGLSTMELVQTSDKWHNEELSFYLSWCCVAWLINEFFDLKRKGRLERG